MYKTIFSEMGIGQMQRGDKPDGVGKMQHEKFGIGKMQHYNDDKKKKNGSDEDSSDSEDEDVNSMPKHIQISKHGVQYKNDTRYAMNGFHIANGNEDYCEAIRNYDWIKTSIQCKYLILLYFT